MKIMLPFILISLYLVRHIINNNKDFRKVYRGCECDTSIMPKYTNVFSKIVLYIKSFYILFCKLWVHMYRI